MPNLPPTRSVLRPEVHTRTTADPAKDPEEKELLARLAELKREKAARQHEAKKDRLRQEIAALEDELARPPIRR